MKKIVVPCDFSKPAINAFRFALDLAVQSRGSIDLIHVIELPILHDTVLMPVLNFEEALLKELKENSETKFRSIVAKYNKNDVKVRMIVAFGTPSLLITDHIAENKVDLVIMGSHGASGIRETFIGSNAEKIVRKSTAPVLVIKNYFKGQIKHIVFPNSLDIENQDELIQKVKALQTFFKAKLHIVWINTLLNFVADTVTRERLKTFVKHYALKDCTTSIFNYPNEESGILHFSKLVKADMIAMGTHGRTGISHLINGSYAEDVVNHADNLIWTYSLKNQSVEA